MKILNVEQGSQAWHMARLGKVTGTRIKDVMKSDNLPLVDEIIAELVSNRSKDFYETEEMRRGSDYEPLAREAYEKQTGMKVETFGMLLHDKYDWLTMSPDGLVKSSGIYSHGIEIKCPNTVTHVKYIRQNQVPYEYKYQVRSMFLINDRLETHDFISYDPRFDLKPLHIVRTTREEIKDELPQIEEDLVKFWNKVLKYHEQVIF